jgi:hypothetical protein
VTCVTAATAAIVSAATNVSSTRDECFQAALECAAFQQDTMVALLAANANISAEPDDLPVVASARMGLSQAHHVSQPQLYHHSK